MAHYRKIDARIWNDAKFRDMSDRAKLVFFMLLTHPHMTSIGAMRASINGLASEMGWPAKAFGEAFGEALEKGMVKHDERACFIWLPRFLKYNGPESPNVLRAWAKSIDVLPECQLKNDAIQNVKAFAEGLSEGFRKAFQEAWAHPSPNQEQEQEQEQDIRTPLPPNGGKRANGIDHELEQAILDAYHELLPTLPAVKILSDKRRKLLRARIAEHGQRGQPANTPEYWRRVFAKVSRSEFLLGANDRGWRADFEWLLNQSNFLKLIEGKYDNTGAARG